MDDGSSPAAPSAEHMLGHGFYSKHAEAQGAANRFGLSLIEQAIAFEPALFAALRADRDEADRTKLSEAFAARLEAALARDPASHGARWVLQLMCIARAGG